MRQQAGAIEIAREDGSVLSVPVTSIAKLQVSSGRKRRTLVGALCGAALGVGITLIGTRCEHPAYCEDNAGYRTAGLVILGGGGALLGAGVGALIRTERWTTVPIPAPERISARRGATLAFTLRF
jgi:hypothetical protein